MFISSCVGNKTDSVNFMFMAMLSAEHIVITNPVIMLEDFVAH